MSATLGTIGPGEEQSIAFDYSSIIDEFTDYTPIGIAGYNFNSNELRFKSISIYRGDQIIDISIYNDTETVTNSGNTLYIFPIFARQYLVYPL